MEDTTASHDLLSEETHPLFRYIQATRGERFANYLIDNLLMRFALSYLTGMAVGAMLSVIAPDFLTRVVYEKDTWDVLLLDLLIGTFNYVVYYTLCEKLFKGQTLGKLITKTRAIRSDGQELTFKDALLRSLSRLIPFEVFSGFGDPWHDTLTGTMVVKTK
ncbi:MAG TPA: RDD family protein [Chitinophagaceae bacterium]|nr:RDD family protein [Chitinophagaceae bacterium]